LFTGGGGGGAVGELPPQAATKSARVKTQVA